MTILDEDPADLLRATTANFQTHEDIACLSRISTSVSTLRSARTLRLDTHRASSASLTRRLASAQAAHADSLASHDASGHAAEILRLDAQKFRAAKAVSEVRGDCERKEGEVRGLERTVEGLEREGVEGGDDGSDSEEDVLRLRVYRGLGIEAEADENGEFRRAVVRNRAKGDVSVVSLEKGRDRMFYAGHFWGCL
ncbi:Spc24-domain-containing protein [Myriangium duriaei CBS 260.36]|uniref:Kinetochore protein Spc24 n=1 Tax=Myriangium duriaei CBS 260.36 TaxID=1168546 RepID=A0A9P4J3W0_9PEZI|nr:Spc24-domain-containing protein [Myriangium duriaei CBS 260.36]